MLAHPACSAPSIQLHPAHSNDAFRPVIPVLSGLNVLCHHVLCADVHHECVLLCALLLVFLLSLTLLRLVVLLYRCISFLHRTLVEDQPILCPAYQSTYTSSHSFAVIATIIMLRPACCICCLTLHCACDVIVAAVDCLPSLPPSSNIPSMHIIPS
jgi:hypothetical protein